MNNRTLAKLLIGCGLYPVVGYIVFGTGGFVIGAGVGIAFFLLAAVVLTADRLIDFDSA